MQLDWLTVAAQIANFLVLIWLLQRFLYAPITRAMARREERIEERLADARKAREAAEAEARKLQEKEDELEASREDELRKARDEAADLRARLEDEAREEIDEKRAAWRSHLDEERDELAQALRRRLAHETLETVRRILGDLAGADLAAELAQEFARRIERLDEDERARLAEAASEEGSALVETAVELPGAAREKIETALRESLAEGLELRYETDPVLLLGLRLTVGNRTAEWSAGQYLDRLEAAIEETIGAGAGEPAEA